MWSIPIKKFFAGTRCAPRPSRRRFIGGEAGQGILEYVLILAVVVGLFLVLAKPFMTKYSGKYQSLFKGGIMADDATGSKFYYYPVR